MNKNQFIKKYYWLIVLLFIIFAFVTRDEDTKPSDESTTTEHIVDNNDQENETKETESATGQYKFRKESLLNQHYEKHGIEMGFDSAEEYEAAASAVVNHPDVLHKTEKEDGDDVYYLEETNEFVVVSTDGYLRTYFYPSDGIDYYNRQ